MCNKDEDNYRDSLIIAGDFNKTTSNVIYNNIALHVPGVAVNLYTNALLKKLTGNYHASITTVNEPTPVLESVKIFSI